MLVSNLNYTPEKGDIVVLRKEGFYGDQPIVKRIIATGGDTVDIDPVTGDVLVNGEALDEPYIAEKINTLEKMGDMTYPQTVPEGCIYVLGDNRNYSTDSRWSSRAWWMSGISGACAERGIPVQRIWIGGVTR